MTTSSAFETAHAFIEKWEGGFANHPDDPGGATNFGITLDTLSRWRGKPVSVEDVRNLTIEEAREIYFANYWTPLRADEMPVSVALMTYNAGVNSGPSRGAKLLQKALNEHGQNLAVDGQIGKKTLTAVGQVDERRIIDSYAAAHESFYRGLRRFGTFGRGWLNRLVDVTEGARNLVGTTVAGSDTQIVHSFERTKPAEATLVPSGALASGAKLAEVVNNIQALRSMQMTMPDTGAKISGWDVLIKVLPELIEPKKGGGDQRPDDPAADADDQTLTPVNNALGPLIGGLLNGRKTGLGILGLLATTVLPAFFPALAPLGSLISATIEPMNSAATPEVVNPSGDLGTRIMAIIQPLFVGLTGWGVLGKMEKWSKRRRP